MVLCLHLLETAQFVQGFAVGSGKSSHVFCQTSGNCILLRSKDNHFESCIYLVHVNLLAKINSVFSVLFFLDLRI